MRMIGETLVASVRSVLEDEVWRLKKCPMRLS